MKTIYSELRAWRVMKPAFKNLGPSVELTLILRDPDDGEYLRIIIEISKEELKILDEIREALEKAFKGAEFEPDEEEPVGLG